jgi:hypothetical protein
VDEVPKKQDTEAKRIKENLKIGTQLEESPVYEVQAHKKPI